MKFHVQSDGEWVQPFMRGYRLACCDCGSVHKINFRIVDGRVQFAAWRLPEETRRHRISRSKTKKSRPGCP